MKRSSRGPFHTSKDTSVPSDDDDDIMHSTPNKQSRLTPLSAEISSIHITTLSQKHDNIMDITLDTPPLFQSCKSRSPVVISSPVGFFHFSKILLECGFSLSKIRNSAFVEDNEFRSKLTTWYVECMNGTPQDKIQATMFIDEMKQYLNSKECLSVAIAPTLHKEVIYQPSLLQSLLGVIPLQPHIFKIILPILTETAYITTDEEEVKFLNLLLSGLRWIHSLQNEEQLVQEIMEILERAKDKAKREMIRLVPDIFSPIYHEKIAETLVKLLKDFSPLSSTIVEAFTALDVSDSTLEAARFECIENMSMVESKELGAFFAFLFTLQDSEPLNSIICSLREKVQLEIKGDDAVATTQELVQKIRFCINTNSKIFPEWLEIIKKDFKTDVTLCTTLDLIMFFIFLEQSCYKKLMEKTLKTLFENEEYVLNLFDDIIERTPAIIDLVFEPISKFLEKLLHNDAKFYSVVKNILVKLFINSTDYNGQTVVVIFTSGLTHGNQKFRETCISGLTMLATQDISKFLKFTPLIMGVMDFIIKFSPSDIRVIMRILAKAAHVPDNRESARFESEFSILIKKQLTNVDERIRCVGVVGSVATIDHFIQQKAASTKIMIILEMTWNYVENHPSACFIFFDELSSLLDHQLIDPLIVEKFKAVLCEKFMQNWVVKAESLQNPKSSSKLKLAPVFDANKELEDVDLIVRFESDSSFGMNSIGMIAHTRLLCVLESQLNDGDLTQIDVTLGLPLLLPQFKLYGHKADTCNMTQRVDLARFMILGINYIRETMAAFLGQQENQIVIKIWYRLSNLVEMQKILADFVLKFGSVLKNLPCAYTSEYLEQIETISVIPLQKKKKTGNKNDNEDSDGEVPGTSKSIPKKSKKKPAQNVKKPTAITSGEDKDFGIEIQPPTLIPYFRSFPKNVFRMLNSQLKIKQKEVDYLDLLLKVHEAPNAEEIMKKIKVLYPHTLVLLLRDLNIQVETLRICIIKDISLDFPSDFFDCLCGHLDTLIEACKKKNAQYEAKHTLEAAFLYVYKTLNNYLNATKAGQYNELFKKVLKTLEKRAGESELEKKEQMALYINGTPDNISSPLAAMEHLKFMKFMYDKSDKKLKSFLRNNINDSIDEYLQRDWKITASMIQSMLKMWLTIHENPLLIIAELTKSIISNDDEEEDEELPHNKLYASCTKLNFQTWYRVLFENLVQLVSKTKVKPDMDELFEFWGMALQVFKKLIISVIKKNRKPTIILPLLKNAKIFLEAFVINQPGSGLKLLLYLWKNKDKERAKELINNLQASARKLQSICEHCKAQKYSQILRYIPPVKRALELLLFRVREQFTANDIPLNLFLIANLKHKSIEGKEVASQIDEESQTQTQDDDGEGVDDGEESNDDIDGDDDDEDMFSNGEDSE